MSTTGSAVATAGGWVCPPYTYFGHGGSWDLQKFVEFGEVSGGGGGGAYACSRLRVYIIGVGDGVQGWGARAPLKFGKIIFRALIM